MIMFTHALGTTPIQLWGIDSDQRLRRMLDHTPGLRWCEDPASLAPDQRLLLIRADYLFELRTLKLLAERDNVLLRCPGDGKLAAASIRAGEFKSASALLIDPQSDPQPAFTGGLAVIGTIDLEGFDRTLRRHEAPLLEPITAATRDALESRLYGNAYKGVTDLVTKWLWPRLARHGVRACTRLGITPNMVTGFGVLLMLAVCVLFVRGHYASGLALGWLMTYLDTVDGKLARVTVQSSRVGHVMDHGMDLLHPPFWYIFWGMSLTAFAPVWGLGQTELYWVIGVGYALGRLVEGLFDAVLGCELFSWRPFDSYFRLITARRNPCLILLTLSVLMARPDWGFVAVAGWTALSTGVLLIRLVQGLYHRLRHGPLSAWLADGAVAKARHARAYRTFSGTRDAYAKS